MECLDATSTASPPGGQPSAGRSSGSSPPLASATSAPLPDRAAPADQADAYALLLDHPGVDRAVAIGLPREAVGPRVRAASSPARHRPDPRARSPRQRGHRRRSLRTSVSPSPTGRLAVLGVQEPHADGVLANDGPSEGLPAFPAGSRDDGRPTRTALPPQAAARRCCLQRVRLEARRGPVPTRAGAAPTPP
jgi:hypothetical protein